MMVHAFVCCFVLDAARCFLCASGERRGVRAEWRGGSKHLRAEWYDGSAPSTGGAFERYSRCFGFSSTRGVLRGFCARRGAVEGFRLSLSRG